VRLQSAGYAHPAPSGNKTVQTAKLPTTGRIPISNQGDGSSHAGSRQREYCEVNRSCSRVHYRVGEGLFDCI